MEVKGGNKLKLKTELTWIIINILKFIFVKLPGFLSIRVGADMGILLWVLSKTKVDKAEKNAVMALGTERSSENHMLILGVQ